VLNCEGRSAAQRRIYQDADGRAALISREFLYGQPSRHRIGGMEINLIMELPDGFKGQLHYPLSMFFEHPDADRREPIRAALRARRAVEEARKNLELAREALQVARRIKSPWPHATDDATQAQVTAVDDRTAPGVSCPEVLHLESSGDHPGTPP
jgi:hypothetical protein